MTEEKDVEDFASGLEVMVQRLRHGGCRSIQTDNATVTATIDVGSGLNAEIAVTSPAGIAARTLATATEPTTGTEYKCALCDAKPSALVSRSFRDPHRPTTEYRLEEYACEKHRERVDTHVREWHSWAKSVLFAKELNREPE